MLKIEEFGWYFSPYADLIDGLKQKYPENDTNLPCQREAPLANDNGFSKGKKEKKCEI